MPRFIETNGIITELDFLNLETDEAKLIDDYPTLQIPLSTTQSPEFNTLMIIGGFTIVIMKRSQCFFVFDSHSRDSRGLLVENGDGALCLLKFDTIFELEKYVKFFYLEFREFQHFQIQFIQINELSEELKRILQLSYSRFVKKNSSATPKKRKNDCADGNTRKRQKTRQQSNQAYYEQNKEKINENNKAYHEQNKEKINENKKVYREQNKEKISENKKAYNEQNKEKISENKR
eukprot:TCONS_00034160-protein